MTKQYRFKQEKNVFVKGYDVKHLCLDKSYHTSSYGLIILTVGEPVACKYYALFDQLVDSQSKFTCDPGEPFRLDLKNALLAGKPTDS